MLDANRFVYPTGGSVHLGYSGDEGFIRYAYETESFKDGEGDLLMAVLPHHVDAGVVAKETVPSPYKTIKGQMTGRPAAGHIGFKRENSISNAL